MGLEPTTTGITILTVSVCRSILKSTDNILVTSTHPEHPKRPESGHLYEFER